MTPAQREAALRLADAMQSGAEDPMWPHHCEMKKSTLGYAAALLRELAAEPQDDPTVKEDLTVPKAFYLDPDAEPAYAQYARGYNDGFTAGMREARVAANDTHPTPRPLTDDTALLFRALNALTYYREQTRPIEVADRVIAALHERLAHGIGEQK